MLDFNETEYRSLLEPFFKKPSTAQASHTMHVKTAWSLLSTFGYPRAFELAAIGYRIYQKPDAKIGYHATITLGYMRLVYDCMKKTPHCTFEEFQIAQPSLFSSGFKMLREFYSEKRLWSRNATQDFIDGDLKPLPKA